MSSSQAPRPTFRLSPHRGRRVLRSLLVLSTALVASGKAGGPDPRAAPPPGQLVPGIACRADPTQTYTLYLPSTFDPSRRWPTLFLFDPRGRSVRAAEIFQAAAEEHGWVLLSSDNTRSDGPWEPNDRALRAMWPEPFERWSADPRRLYAGGFSGGAIAALVLAEMTHQLAGVVGVGGRLPDGLAISEREFAHFGAAGSTDFNYGQMWALERFFADRGSPHRLEIFDGRHQWLPSELATTALAWLEVVAMRQGRRTIDGALAAAIRDREIAAAQALEAARRRLEALWRYETVLRTFEGLADTGAVGDRIEALEKDPLVASERRERRQWDDWEERYEGRLARAFGRAVDRRATLEPRRLESDLGIANLRQKAERQGYEGVVARRVLERIWTHTSFYLTRDLLTAGRYDRALTVLTVAVAIRDDSPFAWYNLACAAARTGARERALSALERAIETGFRDAEHIATDDDLESLRDDERFARLLARLANAGPG